MAQLLPSLATTLFLITCGGAAVCAVYWTGVIGHMIKILVRRPTARVGLALAQANPPTASVAVIIPAHNEARVIEHLVNSLRQQAYPHVQFILSLDRCTDDTKSKAIAAIDGDARFYIHEISHCPPDWAGKVHALHSAVNHLSTQASQPDLLLFADADTRFSPEVIGATVAILRERKLELLSLLSTLSTDKWFEKIVQTAACLEISRQFPLSSVNAPTERRPFANGQFLLFDRLAYESFGGHTAVKDAILEDLALGRLMAKQKRPAQVLLSDDLIRCHMYDTFAGFQSGWKRIFIECVDWKVSRLYRYGWSMLLIGCICPIWSIALALIGFLAITRGFAAEMDAVFLSLPFSTSHLALVLGTWATAAYYISLLLIYRFARAPILAAFTHPIGSFLCGGILLDAARDVKNRVPVRWGGREYTRDPR